MIKNKSKLLLGVMISVTISVLFYIIFPVEETITQALSMSDKIQIFSQEVCYYIKELNLAKEYRELCLELIMKNQENIKQVLADKNTIEEIKDFAKMIVDKQLCEIKNSWYIFLKHVLGIAAISSSIIKITTYYSALWTTFKSLLVPYKAYTVGKEVVSQYPLIREEDIMSIVENFIVKERKSFYSILDIILYYGIEVVPLEIRIILTFTLAGFLGTTLLPRLVSYLESSKEGIRELPIEELVTFSDNMSIVPVIPLDTVSHSVGLSLIFIITLQLRKTKQKVIRIYRDNAHIRTLEEGLSDLLINKLLINYIKYYGLYQLILWLVVTYITRSVLDYHISVVYAETLIDFLPRQDLDTYNDPFDHPTTFQGAGIPFRTITNNVIINNEPDGNLTAEDAAYHQRNPSELTEAHISEELTIKRVHFIDIPEIFKFIYKL